MINTLELLVFINQSFYCYAAFPQIMSNYRNKTGSALSDFYLVMLFNTYFMLLFYFFCLPLPICYRLSVTIQFLTTMALIGQRFYYNRDERWKWVGSFFLVNVGFMLGLMPLAFVSPVAIGNIGGWIACVLIIINRFPQIIHFYRTKSVDGFSPLFLITFGAGGVMEMVVALIYWLPAQTFCMAGAGFLGILALSYQYRLYKKENLMIEAPK